MLISPVDFAWKAFLVANMLLGMIFFFVDEPLHFKRRLGLWERVSHPIDTILNVITQGVGFFALSFHYQQNVYGLLFFTYIALSFITALTSYKDELVHHHEGGPFENFVHACMFTLTGVIFTCGAFLILLNGSAWPFLVVGLAQSLVLIWQISIWWVLIPLKENK